MIKPVISLPATPGGAIPGRPLNHSALYWHHLENGNSGGRALMAASTSLVLPVSESSTIVIDGPAMDRPQHQRRFDHGENQRNPAEQHPDYLFSKHFHVRVFQKCYQIS
jgi:hypothetical protein